MQVADPIVVGRRGSHPHHPNTPKYYLCSNIRLHRYQNSQIDPASNYQSPSNKHRLLSWCSNLPLGPSNHLNQNLDSPIYQSQNLQQFRRNHRKLPFLDYHRNHLHQSLPTVLGPVDRHRHRCIWSKTHQCWNNHHHLYRYTLFGLDWNHPGHQGSNLH